MKSNLKRERTTSPHEVRAVTEIAPGLAGLPHWSPLPSTSTAIELLLSLSQVYVFKKKSKQKVGIWGNRYAYNMKPKNRQKQENIIQRKPSFPSTIVGRFFFFSSRISGPPVHRLVAVNHPLDLVFRDAFMLWPGQKSVSRPLISCLRC